MVRSKIIIDDRIENTFYMTGNSIILETPEDKDKDNQMGAIPFEDLIAIWVYNANKNKYINMIDSYRELYNQEHIKHSL